MHGTSNWGSHPPLGSHHPQMWGGFSMSESESAWWVANERNPELPEISRVTSRSLKKKHMRICTPVICHFRITPRISIAWSERTWCFKEPVAVRSLSDSREYTRGPETFLSPALLCHCIVHGVVSYIPFHSIFLRLYFKRQSPDW